MTRCDQGYATAWVVIVREELAAGRAPEQIAAKIRNQAEWYIGLAWRMASEQDEKYKAIRDHFPAPEGSS